MKLIRYFKFFDYYLKIFAERLSGKSKGNPYHNGEYKVLENVIKRIKFDEPFILIDGGANTGDYSLKANEISKKYNKKSIILAVECHAPTIKLMKENLKNINYQLINRGLGESNKKVIFYSDAKNPTSGQNSNIKHFYLNSKKKIQQITIDKLLKTKKIKHVNFLKLDIEGFEYKALLGAKQSAKNGCIDYIQIEYNQTWIKAGATIEKILLLSKKYNFDLFRIKHKSLLRIEKYSYILEDYVFSNLLMVKKGIKLPLPCKRTAIPDFFNEV
jgi:FkbM family methyltransferase